MAFTVGELYYQSRDIPETLTSVAAEIFKYSNP